MENEPGQEQDQAQTQNQGVSPTSPLPPADKGISWVVILIVLLVVVAIILAIYLFVVKGQGTTTTTPEATTTQPTATASLKTYANANPKYTLQYPSDWVLDSSQASDAANLLLTLTKNGHILEINQPQGYGGSVCHYSDSPPIEESPFINKITGDWAEITNPNYPSRPFRRTAQPSTFEDKPSEVKWFLCQKEAEKTDAQFVNSTVLDLITYLAPANYDEKIVKEMDGIVKTISAEPKK